MPKGKSLEGGVINYVLDMNAQPDADGEPRFSFRQIAQAAGISERMVALIVRRYAAVVRRRHRNAEYIENLAHPH